MDAENLGQRSDQQSPESVVEPSQDETPKSVKSLACEAIGENPNWKVAAALLGGWIKADKDLYESLLEPYFEKAIWLAIRKAATEKRVDFWSDGLPPAPGGTADLEAVAWANAESLLDYPLQGGLLLGDATLKELAEEISLRDKQAQAAKRSSRWFQLIADGLTGEKAVREVFTAPQLQSLQTQRNCW